MKLEVLGSTPAERNFFFHAADPLVPVATKGGWEPALEGGFVVVVVAEARASSDPPLNLLKHASYLGFI